MYFLRYKGTCGVVPTPGENHTKSPISLKFWKKEKMFEDIKQTATIIIEMTFYWLTSYSWDKYQFEAIWQMIDLNDVFGGFNSTHRMSESTHPFSNLTKNSPFSWNLITIPFLLGSIFFWQNCHGFIIIRLFTVKKCIDR